MSRVLYAKPSITERELGYAADAAAHGWGERCYDYVARFQAGFAAHLGTAHALATSSGTGALHLGLAAMGIGPVDEVILADSNWIASAAPIVHLGATPVLVDVLPDTWCIDPAAVAAAVTPRTRAILAVHLYGSMCDMDALLAIGAHHGIPVIEDAAEAIGSSLHGRPAGSLGLWGAFSFHGTKTLSTGEGGMLVTGDAVLFARVQKLSNHGRDTRHHDGFHCDQLGYKFKMSNLQAAIGLGQVERVAELVARKQAILARYQSALADLPLTLHAERPGFVHGAWMPTAILRSARCREALVRAFAAAEIDVRLFFPPLSGMPMFRRRHPTPRATRLARRGLNLPSYHDMTDADQDRVVSAIRTVLAAPSTPRTSARKAGSTSVTNQGLLRSQMPVRQLGCGSGK